MKAKPCILSLLVVVLFFAVSPAFAEKLYKYKDENDVWHFSDSHPDTKQEVGVNQVRVPDLSKKITVQSDGTNFEQFIPVLKDYHGPIEIEIKLTQKNNTVSLPLLPARFVIPASGGVKAVRLWPEQLQKAWSFHFSFRFVFGNPQAAHSPQKSYLLPFAKGNTFQVSQGFHGSYSHNTPHSEYAVDIAMPEGTKVHAARSGVVMEVADDFFTVSTDIEKSGKRANLIRILHEDGTMAVYAHLKLETAQVFAGKKIAAGQLIAESGNTGFSSGPHLHFAVQKNGGMKLVSIPFQFEGPGDSLVTPEQGMVLGKKN